MVTLGKLAYRAIMDAFGRNGGTFRGAVESEAPVQLIGARGVARYSSEELRIGRSKNGLDIQALHASVGSRVQSGIIAPGSTCSGTCWRRPAGRARSVRRCRLSDHVRFTLPPARAQVHRVRVLVVAPAAQGDVVSRRLAAESVRNDVVELEAAAFVAATTVGTDVSAPAEVAHPDHARRVCPPPRDGRRAAPSHRARARRGSAAERQGPRLRDASAKTECRSACPLVARAPDASPDPAYIGRGLTRRLRNLGQGRSLRVGAKGACQHFTGVVSVTPCPCRVALAN